MCFSFSSSRTRFVELENDILPIYSSHIWDKNVYFIIILWMILKQSWWFNTLTNKSIKTTRVAIYFLWVEQRDNEYTVTLRENERTLIAWRNLTKTRFWSAEPKNQPIRPEPWLSERNKSKQWISSRLSRINTKLKSCRDWSGFPLRFITLKI